jgi:hypothetical protein
LTWTEDGRYVFVTDHAFVNCKVFELVENQNDESLKPIERYNVDLVKIMGNYTLHAMQGRIIPLH